MKEIIDPEYPGNDCPYKYNQKVLQMAAPLLVACKERNDHKIKKVVSKLRSPTKLVMDNLEVRNRRRKYGCYTLLSPNAMSSKKKKKKKKVNHKPVISCACLFASSSVYLINCLFICILVCPCITGS